MIAQNDRPAKPPTTMLAFVYAPYAVLIIAVLLAYSNVYRNEFLLDDLPLIRDNRFLASWHYLFTLFVSHVLQGSDNRDAFYRPLLMFLYLIIYQSFGPSTIAFHLLNVVLHSLNACLLYAFGIRIGFQRIAVLPATLLWALHPVQTEAITYISGTAEPLCAMFLLIGMLVLATEFSRRRVMTACLLFVLALMSKETAVVFPLLAMGLLFYRSENRWSPRTYLQTWPFWLMTAVYILARETVLNFNGFLDFYNTDAYAQTSILDRLYTFLTALQAYVRLLVWPTGLHYHLNNDVFVPSRTMSVYRILLRPEFVAGFAILAAALASVVWKPGRRATPLAWGILWAGAAYLPESGLLVRANNTFAEHWLYLPSMGLALGIGESVARWSWNVPTLRLRPLLVSFALSTSLLFGVMTFEQNTVWKDAISFYTRIFTYEDATAVQRSFLAMAYRERGQDALAAEQFRMAITQYRDALALDDHDAQTHFNLALALLYLDEGEPSFDEAMKQLQYTIDLDADTYQVYDTLAAVCASQGDLAEEAEYRARSAAIRKKLGIE